MIIAVDFDGTISRGKYPAIDGEQPYAGESLRKLHSQGQDYHMDLPYWGQTVGSYQLAS